MEWPVRGDDLASGSIGWAVRKVADVAPGFVDDQKSSSDVPGVELQFPVGVEPPSRHVTQVQGSSSLRWTS